MIVLPAIDLRQGRVVRLRQGRAELETVYGDDPASVARRWVAQGAQWLHVVNLDGALGASQPGEHGGAAELNLQHLREIRVATAQAIIQFGGGLRTLEDVDLVLEMGINRAVVGTAAVREPELVAEAVHRFGPERVAVAIDASRGRVVTHGWLETSDQTAVALGLAMRTLGVRHAVYTDIARDGMLEGVNVRETAALARSSGLHVIASGGVATLDDIQALKEQESAGVVGVIVGQALYSGALALREVLEAARR